MGTAMNDAPVSAGPPSGSDLGRDDLPLKDYSHLQLGDLGHRIRSLDVTGLETLLAYERAHAHRAPVLQLLTRRLEGLREGATPSDGDPSATSALAAPAPDGGSPVQPATSGPAMNPPSHGDPTNPAQPRSTG
jgi:hypothetical protein